MTQSAYKDNVVPVRAQLGALTTTTASSDPHVLIGTRFGSRVQMWWLSSDGMIKMHDTYTYGTKLTFVRIPR